MNTKSLVPKTTTLITKNSFKLFLLLLALLFLLPFFANVNSSHAATPQIAAGYGYTIALKSDGTLWSWGQNNYGQLGLGDTTERLSPVQVGSDNKWVSVSAGWWHTIALKSDGTLWAWGYNGQGELGDGTSTNSLIPKQIGSDNKWVSIEVGYGHTIALKSDGTLWAWGYNDQGQLGLGDTTYRYSPVQVGSDNKWVSVSAGVYHTIALKSNGTLWAWGYNNTGQLGDGTTTQRNYPVQIGLDTKWVSISAGYEHTIALKSDGTLWTWGGNTSGELGFGDTTERHVPSQVGTDTKWVSIAAGYNDTIALKSDGTLWAWGNNGNGQLGDGTTTVSRTPMQIGTDTKWVSISAGMFHTAALKSDGSLWSWGYNQYGQLGLGDTFERHVPMITSIAANWVSISAAAEYTLALKTDGTLWAWGYNAEGNLGVGDTTDRPSPAQVGSDNKWASIAAQYYHTIALKSNGTLWAWGNNNIAQLGLGFYSTGIPSPLQVGSDTDWVSIATGADHVVALKSDGTLWAWGGNSGGQLGYTSADTCDGAGPCTKSPTQVGSDTDWVSIAAGAYHTIALKSDGTLWAWGANNAGQLGLGDTTNRPSPVQVGFDNNWVSISAGKYFTIALKSDRTLWTWGSNGDGQLGRGGSGLSPAQVGPEHNWVSISAGWDHTIALKSDGTLWAWGYNGSGQLGQGDTDTTDRYSPVQVGSDNKWASISAGGMHTIALKSDGTLWAWGDNFFGQLGDGTVLTYRYSPELIGIYCTYTVNPVQQFAPYTGDTGYSVNVATSNSSCAWTAATCSCSTCDESCPSATCPSSWIHITGVSSGTGNGIVKFNIDSNSGSERCGTITIAGQTSVVKQGSQAIVEQITQQQITVTGPGQILVKTRFMNNSGDDIWTIRPDCYNTYFWLTDSSGNVVPRWCVIGPPYGIPNDVVYIPAHTSYPPSGSLICDISNRYPDLAPDTYSVLATYANYIEDRRCSDPTETECIDLWTGAVASGTASLTVHLYVTQPNGGEILPSGGAWGICWQAPSTAKKFDLMYSTNNGINWNFIKSVTGLNCSNWDVPTVTANKNKCLVKVIGYDSASVKIDEDKSDKPFTIAVLMVTSPNGGEILRSGNTWNISWRSFKTIRPVAKTKLLYTSDGGATWNPIKTLTGDPGATIGSYSWTVPNVSSSRCKVKVVLKDSSGVTIGSDISNKPFTIQP